MRLTLCLLSVIASPTTPTSQLPPSQATWQGNPRAWEGLNATQAFDGTRLLAAEGRTVRLWDLRSGSLLRQITNPPRDGAASVALSPNGKYALAVGLADNGLNPMVDASLRVWDVTSGEVLLSVEGDRWSSQRTGFVRNGNAVYFANRDHPLRLWTLPTRRLIYSAPRTKGYRIGNLNDQGTRAFFSVEGGGFDICAIPSGRRIAHIADDPPSTAERELGFSADGTRFLISYRHPYSESLIPEMTRVYYLGRDAGSPVTIPGGMARAASASTLVTADSRGTVRTFDASSLKMRRQIPVLGEIGRLIVNPTGTRCLAIRGSADGSWMDEATLIDLKAGKIVAQIADRRAGRFAGFGADGQTFLTLERDEEGIPNLLVLRSALNGSVVKEMTRGARWKWTSGERR